MARHAKRRAEDAVPSRGMTAQEAADFYGISSSTFYNKQRKGEIPRPTLPCGRYDRVLLERAMDKLSGINSELPALTPLDEWRNRRGSRQS
jgi:hypothetical protein